MALTSADVCATAGCCGSNNKFRCKGYYKNLGNTPFDKLLTVCNQNGSTVQTQEGPAIMCKEGQCFYLNVDYQEKCDQKLGTVYTSCGFVNNQCNSPVDCDDPLLNPPPPDPVLHPEEYPVITLKGPSYIELYQNEQWVDPGFSSTDQTDGDYPDYPFTNPSDPLTSHIFVTDPVDTSIPRTYSVFYRVKNSKGWSDTEIRTVKVLPI